MSAAGEQHTHIKGIIFFLLLLLIYSGVIFPFASEIGDGGNSWNQGDWLINNEYVVTRRGVLGSWLIALSDVLGGNPLYVVAAVQFILISFVFISVYAAVSARQFDGPVIWLVLSPAFVFLFWLHNPQGGFRKELIVYFSYSLVLLSVTLNFRQMWVIVFSALGFIVSVFAHEANFSSLPFFLFMIWLLRERYARWHLGVLAVCVVIGSVAGMVYALSFSRVENTELICAALTERGLSDHLCSGAIEWLSDDIHAALAHVKRRIESGTYWIYIVAYLLSLIPFLLFRPEGIKQKYYFACLLLGIGCFAPLFIVGEDWGRWISFYITSITMIALVDMSIRGRSWEIGSGNRAIVTVIAILHVALWSFPHVGGSLGLGLVDFAIRIGNKAARLLS